MAGIASRENVRLVKPGVWWLGKMELLLMRLHVQYPSIGTFVYGGDPKNRGNAISMGLKYVGISKSGAGRRVLVDVLTFRLTI